MPRFARLIPVLVLVALAGACGKSEPAVEQPKTDLNEEQKQQVNDLKEQRQKEWGNTKKGK